MFDIPKTNIECLIYKSPLPKQLILALHEFSLTIKTSARWDYLVLKIYYLFKYKN